MRYTGSLRLLVSIGQRPVPFVPDEALPEIVPGAFAAWAQASGDTEARADGPVGAPCVTPAGRAGRIVELVESGRSIRVCVRA